MPREHVPGHSKKEICLGTVMGKGEAFDSTLYNEDLAPIPRERRNWSWVNYLTVWIEMVHNVGAYGGLRRPVLVPA